MAERRTGDAEADEALRRVRDMCLALPETTEMEGSLRDGDAIRAGDLEMCILHTPGHTPGSVTFVVFRLLGLQYALHKFREFDRLLGMITMGAASDPAGSYERVLRWSEARNLLLVARLVPLAALDREESRGAHYREDFPNPLPEWRRHQSLTVDRLA